MRLSVTLACLLCACILFSGCGNQGTVELLQTEPAGEAAGRTDSEDPSVLQNVFEKAQGAVESINSAGSALYEMYAGGSDSDFADFDAWFSRIDEINAAIDEYVLEKNAGEICPGDVQILPGGIIYAEDNSELKEFREIYYAVQYNYVIDDRDQLRFADEAKDLILFSFEEQEDGSIVVKDARFADREKDLAASLEEMCDEMGAPLDEAMDAYEFLQIDDVRELRNYLNDHPEYIGIEYEGEILTADELYEIWSKRLEQYG